MPPVRDILWTCGGRLSPGQRPPSLTRFLHQEAGHKAHGQQRSGARTVRDGRISGGGKFLKLEANRTSGLLGGRVVLEQRETDG